MGQVFVRQALVRNRDRRRELAQVGADALSEDEGRGRRVIDILLLRGQVAGVGIEARRDERTGAGRTGAGGKRPAARFVAPERRLHENRLSRFIFGERVDERRRAEEAGERDEEAVVPAGARMVNAVVFFNMRSATLSSGTRLRRRKGREKKKLSCVSGHSAATHVN